MTTETDNGKPGIAKLIASAPKVTATLDHVTLIDASTIRPTPIRWLWPGWLARGKLHVLAGAPGTGKTTIALHIAACVSAGTPLPSGWRPARGNVLIWSGEDDPADTLVPRLIAAGADLSRVRIVGEVVEGGQRYAFDPARDVDKLAAASALVGNVTMIVVDPLVSAVSGDSHKNAEVRRGLQPLVDLAGRLGAALVGITHYSKGTQGRDPLERVTGSLAFGALARIVYGTVRQQAEEGEPATLTFARAKSNIGPDGGGYAYGMEQVEIDGGIHTSRVTWGAAVEGSARELLAEGEPENEAGADAASFLRDLLKNGSASTNGIFADAKGAGFSVDQMKRAKRKIGAVAWKEGMKGAWHWRLANAEERAEGSEGSEQKSPHSSLPSEGESHPSGAGVAAGTNAEMEVFIL
ncbi:MAG: AAA family ATPase [Rudaea sp.]|uniref:AAA family ATPase n=1 Tax=Rudaea sp. TaxID=2136325 RepID=UPI0039E5E9AB